MTSTPAVWQSWGRILRAQPGWLGWLTLASLLLIALELGSVVAHYRGPGARWIDALGVAGACCLLGAWPAFIDGLMRQNRANHARLVPGHVRRLREVLLFVWCLGHALLAVAVVLMGGPVAKAVLYAAGLFAMLALAMRWPLLWIVLWFLLSGLRPVADQALAVMPVGSLWLTVAAVVLAIGLPLCLLVGTGSERHRRHGQRRVAWESSLKGGLPRGGDLGWPWDAFSRLARAPFDAALARAVERAGGSVWPRLMLAFGPNGHPSVHAFWAVVILALGGIVLIVLTALGRFPPESPRVLALAGPAMGLMSLALSATMGLPSNVAATRREQGLVAILPGVPRGRALNQGLAARWLAQFAIGWSIGATLVMLAVSWLLPASVPLFAAGLLSLWPLAALLVRDLAHARPQAVTQVFAAIALLLPGPAVVGLAALNGVPVLAAGAGVALASAAWLVWRWRVIGRAPNALPTGRLA